MLLKKYILLFAICLFINSCTDDCDNDFEGKPFDKEVIVFYPSWRTKQLPIQSIPWQYITRIIYAFAAPLENGNLDTQQLINSDLLVKTAHKNGVEVYFTIGGGGGKSTHFPATHTRSHERVDAGHCAEIHRGHGKNHCRHPEPGDGSL